VRENAGAIAPPVEGARRPESGTATAINPRVTSNLSTQRRPGRRNEKQDLIDRRRRRKLLVAVTLAALGVAIHGAFRRSERAADVPDRPQPLAAQAVAAVARAASIAAAAAPIAATSAEAPPAAPHVRPKHFPDTPVGELLKHHFKASLTIGEGAEKSYFQSLAELRAHAREAVGALWAGYRSAEEDEYTFRMVSAYTLGLLGDSSAIAPLREIATSPLPPERGEGDHADSRAEESAIRMAAIDGLTALAAGGAREAADVLLELASGATEDVSARNRAIWGFREAGSDRAERDATLRRILPADLHDLVDRPVTRLSAALAATPPADTAASAASQPN
jgi:hypothetical protein